MFLTASFCVSFLGSDVTIVAHSLGVQKAIEGAEELVKEGISCEVSLNTFSAIFLEGLRPPPPPILANPPFLNIPEPPIFKAKFSIDPIQLTIESNLPHTAQP